MCEERKKARIWPWAVAMLLTAVLAYPLSMGPYWRVRQHVALPLQIENALHAFYDPVWKAYWSGPKWFENAMQCYLGWWADGVQPAP